MGNDQSTKEKERIEREAYTQALLEKQRKMYEKKCEILLKQAQTPHPPNVVRVEQVHVGNICGQSSNKLYPNLNIDDTRQKSPNNNMTAHDTRIFAAASTNDNIMLKDPYVREASTSLILPSAPQEPSAPNQLQQDNKKRERGPRVWNSSVGKEYICDTCGKRLGLSIFQCTNGHNSCRDCRISGRTCGKYQCGSIITDMRNGAVELLVADLLRPKFIREREQTTKGEQKLSCPNQCDGCILQFSKKDMAGHVKECPFKELPCPLAPIFGQCVWRGRINHLVDHFTNCHPEHRQANVDTEMTILDIKDSRRIVHLVTLGKFKFLVSINVDLTTQNIYMAVQFFGTTFGASKWTYQLHVYKKSVPRRKYQYSDVCLSNSVPTGDIFVNNTCAVIPVSYFRTFENNNGSINYKFYIKKLNDNTE